MTTTYRTLASGTVVRLDSRGRVVEYLRDEPDPDWEGPTCSICDGLGHGYPGGGPCPLEDRSYDEPAWAL